MHVYRCFRAFWRCRVDEGVVEPNDVSFGEISDNLDLNVNCGCLLLAKEIKIRGKKVPS